MTATDSIAAREIVITRVVNAPRDVVFQMFTDPKHLVHWWGPKGFSITIHEIDVRPGGTWRLTMHGPDGRDYLNHIVYKEVSRPERIVFEHQPQHGSEPVSHETTITLTSVGGKTEVVLRMLFASAKQREYVVETYHAIEGGEQTLGRLADLAATQRPGAGHQVLITRTIDAPRELVYKAWTEADRLKLWWGPKGFTNPRCEIDARAGGEMRIDMQGPDGTIYPMSGRYLELMEPERIVFVSSALDQNGWPLFENHHVVTLEAQGDKTRLTIRAQVMSTTEEGAKYLGGMDEGWSMTIDGLVDYLARR
jgi:uncharacterized protein YndB with AHSA1/START domain